MTTTIKTNNHPKNILYWYDLSVKEQKEFDYLSTEERQSDATFFRYKGNTYDIGEFMYIGEKDYLPAFKGWTGYASDSFFSGILIKYVNNYEHVIVGTYYS